MYMQYPYILQYCLVTSENNINSYFSSFYLIYLYLFLFITIVINTIVIILCIFL